MKIYDFVRLIFSPILLHEWCHAQVLITSGLRVYIIQGISDKERGRKLLESYFMNSMDYTINEICGIPFYKHVNSNRKIHFRGRAEVDNRTLLDDKLVIKALKAPIKIGTFLALTSSIIVIYLTVIAINTLNYWLLIGSFLALWFTLLGIYTVSGSFNGVKSDVYLLKHLEEYKKVVNNCNY
ncbi:hypothetical protein PMSD_05020 [Paenibacillus macquariensis subsp. defensor]|nr:hypothetical protein PMSD_05020 [Paenibacillus macquariensis subsp. defensor]